MKAIMFLVYLFCAWLVVTIIYALIALFQGKGNVDITFTPEPEPVYEYQWLMKNHVDGTVFVTSQFFKSLRSLRNMGNHIEILERLDKYKRISKE